MPNKADLFIYSDYTYDVQFRFILAGLVEAYHLMLTDCSAIENRETTIRNYLCENYLQNGKFKEKYRLQPFHFDAESAEIKNSKEEGFIDIKVITTDTFFKPKDYYTIECKRLDGDYRDGRVLVNPPYRTNSLAVEYIKNGIMRFVINKYPTPLGVNGMIGFIVKPTNIDDGIDDINNLISSRFSQSNTTNLLSKISVIENFDFVYISTHTDSQSNSIDLYHLMLDFSSIMI